VEFIKGHTILAQQGHFDITIQIAGVIALAIIITIENTVFK